MKILFFFKGALSPSLKRGFSLVRVFSGVTVGADGRPKLPSRLRTEFGPEELDSVPGSVDAKRSSHLDDTTAPHAT